MLCARPFDNEERSYAVVSQVCLARMMMGAFSFLAPFAVSPRVFPTLNPILDTFFVPEISRHRLHVSCGLA